MAEMGIKEERIRKLISVYYSRQDIRKAILDFAKNREVVPRYFEGFGKRPDTLQYESDILELAKRGATSFHCSEELWRDPLEIATGMSEEQLNELRIGWDLLIDIDSKYIDYSKIYAEILIDVLRKHGVEGIGVKFSGSKGFHIIVPWQAFPEEMSGLKTKDMFPEWPRIICQYLNSEVALKLRERILEFGGAKEDVLEVFCASCNTQSKKTTKIFLRCSACRTEAEVLEEIIKRKRILRCPNCTNEMDEVRREPLYVCFGCNRNSSSEPNNFKDRVKTEHIDADILLVSSRHLFRMPYSLHEKTSLASVVLDPLHIKDFNIKDADPFKAIPRSFLPNSVPGEATNLLRRALEFKPPEQGPEPTPEQSGKKRKFKEIEIRNLSPDLYPPSIKIILKGMKSDGRKRALFILLNFFRSLKVPEEDIKNTIEDWNKKNYDPLTSGYVKAQITWHLRNPARLPPNFDKPHYRDLGLSPTPSELKAKNPISYVARRSFAQEKEKSKKK